MAARFSQKTLSNLRSARSRRIAGSVKKKPTWWGTIKKGIRRVHNVRTFGY